MNVTSTCRAHSEMKILLSKGMICGVLEMFFEKNVVTLTAQCVIKKEYKTRFCGTGDEILSHLFDICVTTWCLIGTFCAASLIQQIKCFSAYVVTYSCTPNILHNGNTFTIKPSYSQQIIEYNDMITHTFFKWCYCDPHTDCTERGM